MHVQLVTASDGTAFCLGDSGAPMTSLPSGSPQRVTAVGVVSGVRSDVSVRCSGIGIIAPLGDLFRTVHGLQLHTLP